MTEDQTGYSVMRAEELACEAASAAAAPQLTAVLRECSDCILKSVHALEGIEGLDRWQQAVFTQLVLGARTGRVFVGLALTGHYESAMAVARMLTEDGIACAYLAGHHDEAERWIDGEIRPRYGDMARAVIESSAQQDPSDRDAWMRAGDVLKDMRRILDDLSHANPQRFKFIRQAHGYNLYPYFDLEALELVAYFAMHALAQLLSFSRRWTKDFGREAPLCNSEDLDLRMKTLLDGITAKAEQASQGTSPDGKL